MSTSSEEVLLIVKNVRNKKCDGVLYMMGGRLAWIQQTKQAFSISYLYAEIKSQKISPVTKEKVQLQVVLQDGGANTFHFDNPISREHQQADRDACWTLLNKLLPKFRKQMNNELEQKNNILTQCPDLFNLYKDLVVTGIITASQFWFNRKELNDDTLSPTIQKTGVSLAFLDSIKPRMDGCNVLHYNLTIDVIDSIMRTYPAVKKKFEDAVPEQMSEIEFWQKYFQSHYLHRDRITSTESAAKDMFAECAVKDDKEYGESMNLSVIDPKIHLNGLKDCSLMEGYGYKLSTTKPCDSNVTMIRQLNLHSNMVLLCPLRGDEDSVPMTDLPDTTSPASTSTINNLRVALGKDTLKKRVHESVHQVDHNKLDPEEVPMDCKKLRLENDSYVKGLIEKNNPSFISKSSLEAATAKTHRDSMGWKHSYGNFPVITSSLATSVLGELSPGGALMKPEDSASTNQILPKNVDLDIQRLYRAVYELLNNFWKCFPILPNASIHDMVLAKKNLDNFNETIIQKQIHKLHQSHYNNNALKHINEIMQNAFKKYANWMLKYSKRSCP